MTNDLIFGIPTRTKKVHVEPYPTTPVMTVHETVVEAGKSSRITFNPTAITTLGLDFESSSRQTVSFAFTDGNTFIVNSTNMDTIDDKNKYRVYKNATLLNKVLHNYLVTKKGGAVGDYNLVEAPNNSYQLVLMVPGTEIETTDEPVEEIIEEAIPVEEGLDEGNW